MILRTLILGTIAGTSTRSLLTLLSPIGFMIANPLAGIIATGATAIFAFSRQRKNREAFEATYELYQNLKKIYEPIEDEMKKQSKTSSIANLTQIMALFNK